jgi:hypothetical protein
MTNFKDRIIRAAKLDVNLYEEIEADKGAMGQAMAVVVLSMPIRMLHTAEMASVVLRSRMFPCTLIQSSIGRGFYPRCNF